MFVKGYVQGSDRTWDGNPPVVMLPVQQPDFSWYGHGDEHNWRLQIKQLKTISNKISKTKKISRNKTMAIVGTALSVEQAIRVRFCSNCGTAKPTEPPSLQMKCSECSEIIDLANGIRNSVPTAASHLRGVPLDLNEGGSLNGMSFNKYPNCGGALTFDPGDQKFHCPSV